MNDKVEKVLDGLVKTILSDDELPKMITADLVVKPYCPSSDWSFSNRLIIAMNGTTDARGFRQWQDAGRQVKKGARAIYILAPMIIKKEDKEGELKPIIIGFRAIPVFRFEDTEGEPLPIPEGIEAINGMIKRVPLYDIAEKMGCSVKADGSSHGEGGYFKPSTLEIVLCTAEEQVFFHELAHAIDRHLDNRPEGISIKDYAMGEVVAELSAAWFATMYGKKANLDKTRKYITSWSNGHPGTMIMKALKRVDAVIRYASDNTISEAVA